MNKKILFIVEGNKDEVSFLSRLYSVCFSKTEYDIYSYKTNIHALSQILYNEYPNFDEDDVDIRLVLKSKEENEEKRKVLEQAYNDIYLIFDFEPHHDFPHFDTLRRMMNFFNDSTDHGKLFINYPMMQSFKHLKTLPDAGFEDRSVSVERAKRYKEIVGNESDYTDLQLYDYFTFASIAVHHIKKANKILCGEYVCPEAGDYLLWDLIDIYDKQQDFLEKSSKVYVLNTSIFLLVDYKPRFFFDSIKRRKEEFYI